MSDSLDRLVYQLGYLLGRAGDAARGAASRAGELEERLEERLGDRFADLDLDLDAEDVTRMGAWGAGAAASLVLSRVLSPRRVDWRRAALAGIVATLAYDAVAWLDETLAARREGARRPERSGAEELTRLAARYSAGMGLAMVYARFLHRRIPGPRVVGGLAFGVADGVAGAAGGLLPLAHQLAPSVPLPFKAQGLTPAAQVTLRTLARHAAFGAALGAVYDDDDA